MNLTKQIVDQFLSARKKASTTLATGVMMCILSPVALLILLSMARLNLIPISVDVANAIGIIILLIIIASSVGLFLFTGFKLKSFEKLEYDDFTLNDELAQDVQKEKERYSSTYATMTIIATVLCILAVIPIISGVFFAEQSAMDIDDITISLVAATLVLIAIGVFLFVKCNTIMNSYRILLQTGDYTAKNKQGRKIMNKYAAIYWMVATLLYLGYSFITNNWEHSWIVWPIAGISYGILEKILTLKSNNVASE